MCANAQSFVGCIPYSLFLRMTVQYRIRLRRIEHRLMMSLRSTIQFVFKNPMSNLGWLGLLLDPFISTFDVRFLSLNRGTRDQKPATRDDLSHMLHNSLRKLGAFHLGGPLHLARKVVGYGSSLNGGLERTADQCGGFAPSHVVQHHGTR